MVFEVSTQRFKKKFKKYIADMVYNVASEIQKQHIFLCASMHPLVTKEKQQHKLLLCCKCISHGLLL